MKKKWLWVALVLIMLVGLSGCSNFQDKSNAEDKSNVQDKSKFQEKKEETKSTDLLTLDENICVKDGENYEDRIILTNTDFVGFKYNVSESQNVLFIYLKLTSEGQKKQEEATKKFTEFPGFLSVWLGDELISAKKMWSHITNDEFVISVPDIREDELEAYIDKLKGKTNNNSVTQEKTQETLPDIDVWNKEVISDKPGDIHIRYFVIKEDGSEWTILDVYNMVEEHDIDNDGKDEIVVYIKGDKRNIGIYDVIDGVLNYTDVRSKLGATWSEYMGNMGNVKSDYSNCIEVGFEDFNKDIHYDVYQYNNDKLIYLCPFYKALRE